jgi:hypothetical protein
VTCLPGRRAISRTLIAPPGGRRWQNSANRHFAAISYLDTISPGLRINLAK